MKKFLSFILALTMIFSASVATFANEAEVMAYTTSIKRLDAAIDYLNAEYFDSELGNQIEYATPIDIEILTKLANKITLGCSSDLQKCLAISKWIKNNIKNSFGSYAAIDVFRTLSGVCSGHSQLFATLARLSGVEVAICRGAKMNTKIKSLDFALTKGVNNYSHEWCMAYCDDDWYLFDDLWGNIGVDDKDLMAEQYFISHVDGIVAYAEDCFFASSSEGRIVNTVYKDGQFICMKDFAQITNYGNASLSVGGCLRYQKMYTGPSAGNYVSNSNVDNTTAGYAMAGGIYSYFGNIVNILPNGIVKGASVLDYNGKSYICLGTESIVATEDIWNNGFTDADLNMYIGESINFGSLNAKKTYKVMNGDSVTVNESGVITAVKAGRSSVRVYANGIGCSLGINVYGDVISSNLIFQDLCDHDHIHIVSEAEYCDYCGKEIKEEIIIEKPEIIEEEIEEPEIATEESINVDEEIKPEVIEEPIEEIEVVEEPEIATEGSIEVEPEVVEETTSEESIEEPEIIVEETEDPIEEPIEKSEIATEEPMELPEIEKSHEEIEEPIEESREEIEEPEIAKEEEIEEIPTKIEQPTIEEQLTEILGKNITINKKNYNIQIDDNEKTLNIVTAKYDSTGRFISMSIEEIEINESMKIDTIAEDSTLMMILSQYFRPLMNIVK